MRDVATLQHVIDALDAATCSMLDSVLDANQPVLEDAGLATARSHTVGCLFSAAAHRLHMHCLYLPSLNTADSPPSPSTIHLGTHLKHASRLLLGSAPQHDAVDNTRSGLPRAAVMRLLGYLEAVGLASHSLQPPPTPALFGSLAALHLHLLRTLPPPPKVCHFPPPLPPVLIVRSR